jgi:hypothetical protein
LSLPLVILPTAATLLLAMPAQATVIYESATLGPTGQVLGATITSEQNLGARFPLSESTHITAIGGHLLVEQQSDNPGATIFGAIIPLASATGLPSFPAAEIESFALAHALILGPGPSSDILVPLDVTLGPGFYGLIFGGADTATGFFPLGATGTGVMPLNNSDLPEASYFFSFGFGGALWLDGISHGFSGARFVVEGTPVAEPSTMLLLGSGLAGLGGMTWKRHRRGCPRSR